jgi:predicted MFS family arabinose efflux permease
MGVWAAIATGGAAVGLLLGGILTDFLSWPWIFFVNIPVGAAAFVLSLRYVPESRADAEHRIFDIPGAVTVTAGLISLVYAIVSVQEHGWLSANTIGFGLVALVLLSAFVAIERRQRAPLVRLGVFRIRTLRAANVAMLLVASGLFAMFFFNTLYVQRVLGFSPLQAGLAFLPVTVGIALGAGLSQIGVKRLGVRTTSLIGLSTATVVMLLLLTNDANGTYLRDVLPGLIPISIGIGLTFVPVTLLATSGIERRDAGLASGLFNTSQQVGGALGLAILSTIAVDRTTNALSGIQCRPTATQQAEALVTGLPRSLLRQRRLLRRRDLRTPRAAQARRRRAGRRRAADDRARRLTRLQGVKGDPERDREAAVDRPLRVAREVEVVRVAEAVAPVHVAEVLVAAVDGEVEHDRNEVGVRDRFEDAPQNGERHRPLGGDRELLLGGVEDLPRGAEERPGEHLPEGADALALGRRDVVAGRELHQRAGL